MRISTCRLIFKYLLIEVVVKLSQQVFHKYSVFIGACVSCNVKNPSQT